MKPKDIQQKELEMKKILAEIDGLGSAFIRESDDAVVVVIRVPHRAEMMIEIIAQPDPLGRRIRQAEIEKHIRAQQQYVRCIERALVHLRSIDSPLKELQEEYYKLSRYVQTHWGQKNESGQL